MKRAGLIILPAVIALWSCTGSSTPPVTVGDKKTADETKIRQTKKQAEYNFYSQYEYSDSVGARLIIQNSFPKSGIHYTDPNGQKFVYAVFWTNIINETNAPFNLTIEPPSDSFEIPSSSRNYMWLLLPPDTVKKDNVPLYDYGLAVKTFLDEGFHQRSALKKTIYPNQSSGFYAVTLSNRGVGSTLRTGLSIEEQRLFYTINNKEIDCGKVSSHSLRLQKQTVMRSPARQPASKKSA